MDKTEEISKYLKAVADPTRLKIIELISNKPLCVNAIVKRLNITQSAVSQHLRILRQMNIVHANRMGYHIHYQVNTEEIQKLTNMVTEIFTKKSE